MSTIEQIVALGLSPLQALLDFGLVALVLILIGLLVTFFTLLGRN